MSKQKKSPKRNCGAADSPAKTSVLPASAAASKPTEAASTGRGMSLSESADLRGSSSKTSSACSPVTTEEIFSSSYPPSSDAKFLCLDMDGGLTQDLFGHPAWRSLGASLTLNISDSPNDAAACSLSDILEAEVPQKYFLSTRACAGILRRSEKRGVRLPERLRQALLVGSQTKKPISPLRLQQALDTTDGDLETKTLRETRLSSEQSRAEVESADGLSAQRAQETDISLLPRRLTPKECERLQGFPDDWTRLTAPAK
jgi:hypothetical protein